MGSKGDIGNAFKNLLAVHIETRVTLKDLNKERKMILKYIWLERGVKMCCVSNLFMTVTSSRLLQRQ